MRYGRTRNRIPLLNLVLGGALPVQTAARTERYVFRIMKKKVDWQLELDGCFQNKASQGQTVLCLLAALSPCAPRCPQSSAFLLSQVGC